METISKTVNVMNKKSLKAARVLELIAVLLILWQAVAFSLSGKASPTSGQMLAVVALSIIAVGIQVFISRQDRASRREKDHDSWGW